jgi:hypothetical protein
LPSGDIEDHVLTEMGVAVAIGVGVSTVGAGIAVVVGVSSATGVAVFTTGVAVLCDSPPQPDAITTSRIRDRS